MKEMAEMAVDHESMNAKNQLIITSYEDHFCSLGSSLKEATDQKNEKSQAIESLEAYKAELVCLIQYIALVGSFGCRHPSFTLMRTPHYLGHSL